MTDRNLMKLPVAIILVLGCAHGPPHTSESERAARIKESAMHAVKCPDWERAPFGDSGLITTPFDNCYDREGITWSQCAWNAMGGDPDKVRAADARVMAGSCGGPEWPPCKPEGR